MRSRSERGRGSAKRNGKGRKDVARRLCETLAKSTHLFVSSSNHQEPSVLASSSLTALDVVEAMKKAVYAECLRNPSRETHNGLTLSDRDPSPPFTFGHVDPSRLRSIVAFALPWFCSPSSTSSSRPFLPPLVLLQAELRQCRPSSTNSHTLADQKQQLSGAPCRMSAGTRGHRLKRRRRT